MKTKVMLINPFTTGINFENRDHLYHFPIGLLYIASVLERNNVDVKIVDFNNLYYTKPHRNNLQEDNVEDYIETELPRHFEDFIPDIIGIGCIFSGAFGTLKIIADRAKKLFPNVQIVIGGIHATIFATKILEQYDYIDYVIIGEGEVSFLELIKCLVNNKEKPVDMIDGIVFRRNGKIIKNNKTKFISNLDELPLVNFKLLNLKDYTFDTSGWYSPKKIKIGLPFPILSSRSCPRRCSFCCMWFVHGPKIRLRSVQQTIDEIQKLHDNYSATYFSFLDDNLTFNKKRILAICNEIIKKGLDIQFDTPNGLAINSLDEEVIDTMIAAGLVKINLSVESGSEYIRNEIIGKRLKTEKIYEVFEKCAKHKHLYIGAYFIIGMPQETYQTLQETYDMITRLPIDRLSFSYATPYPGTQLYNYCVKNNLLDYDYETCFDFKKEYLCGGELEPYFKPHSLNKEDLMKFFVKCKDYIREKRKTLDLPENYPLRYKDFREITASSGLVETKDGV